MMKAPQKVLRAVRALERYEDLLKGGYRPMQAARAAARHSRISVATLNRFRGRVKGAPRHQWPRLLSPRWTGRVRRELAPAAWAMLERLYLSERRSLVDCIKRLQQAAITHGWWLPARRSLYRRIKLQLLTPEEWRRHHLPGVPSKISSDAEVREFVTKVLGTMTFVAIADACRKKFGAARAPGKSTIHRFWQATPKQSHGASK